MRCSMGSYFLTAIVLVSLAACIEGRKEQPAPDVAPLDTTPTASDFGRDIEQDTKTAAMDLDPNRDRCVVAIRTDNCCTAAELAFEGAVAFDRCLVLWPPSEPVDPECESAWEAECSNFGCSWLPPPSRVAEQGVGEDCQYVDECATENDCIVAQNKRFCCPCDEAYPKAQLEVDPCIVDANTLVPGACIPTQGCPGYCSPCRPVESTKCETEAESFSRCETVYGI